MKPLNDWTNLLSELTADIPADELEADIVLADIAGKLSAERVKKNMSQKEFAKLLGVSQGRISKMESGDCNFSVRRLFKIAHKLSIPLKIQFGEKPILQAETFYSNASTACFAKGKKSAYSNLITFPTSYNSQVNYPFADLKEQ